MKTMDEKMRKAFELDHECAFTGNNDYERGYASGYLSALSQPAADGCLPAGWVPLTLAIEEGYPEEVAYGPQVMMDRLKKWLTRYYAMLALTPPTDTVTMTREKFEERLLDVAKEAYKQGEHDGRFHDEYSSTRPATIVAQHMPEVGK